MAASRSLYSNCWILMGFLSLKWAFFEDWELETEIADSALQDR